MATPQPAAQPTLDGRSARARRTRDAVVRALLGLIAEGDLRPTAGRIAERAGISLRSVYVHFEDLDDLFLAAAREQRTRVGALVRPLSTDGPFEDRLVAFSNQRTAVLDAIAPVAKATALQEPWSPALANATRYARRQGRVELERVFAIELDALGPETRARTLDACDALTSSESWEFLRVRRNLGLAAATATVTDTLRALLRAGDATATEARATMAPARAGRGRRRGR
ncbi:MAG TPA: TetR/AcrR family transcriptional regulator [Acidimicrobiia bacterium]|nr:TetR/AcrR family transcriptional regulator [Acidimicrobiia bacterium]